MGAIKKMSKLGAFLCAMSLVSGCGNTNSVSESKSSDSVSTRNESTDKTVENSTEYTSYSSSIVMEKESIEQIKLKEGDVPLDFAQIQQGDYSSLMGDWEEVATLVNRYRGDGREWEEPENNKILISKNEIVNDGAILSNNGLASYGKQVKVDFNEENNQLTGASYYGTQLWTISFYPKGVEWESSAENPPTWININKDRILIGTNQYRQVFQRNKATALEEQESLGLKMNIDEIQQGNYASLNGTWKNSKGESIFVTNGHMQFTDVTGVQNAGEVNGLQINIPDWNDPDGTPKISQQDLNLGDNRGISQSIMAYYRSRESGIRLNQNEHNAIIQ